jgi:hypothetical protein
MTPVELRRLDDRFPPLRELLFVEPDGGFRMWRSNAAVVGWFAGRLPDAAGFASLAEAAAAEEPPASPGGATRPADAVVDELRVGEMTFATAPWDRGSGAWGVLLAACRELLEALLDQPAAAVALVLPSLDQGAPGTARLEHRGEGVLPVELGAASISVEAYTDAGGRVGFATAEGPGLRHVDAGPGWTADLSIPPLDVQAGTEIVVRVTFVADDEGVVVPVQLSASFIAGAG